MNPLVKKLENLNAELSTLNFINYPTSSNKDRIAKIENEIKSIEKELTGYKGVAVRLSHNGRGYDNSYMYLSADETLCFSDSPTIFENEREAREYLNKAKIGNPNDYNIEFINTYYGEKLPRYPGDNSYKQDKKQQNTNHGKWILSDEIDTIYGGQLYQCPFCKILTDKQTEKCQFCGAKLDPADEKL